MQVIMTRSERQRFRSGQGIKVVNDDIEKLEEDSEVKRRLGQELGGDFSVWYTETVSIKNLRNKVRYESFVNGYLYFYDIQVRHGLMDHSVYFKWRQDQVTVFLSPPAVLVTSPVHYSFDINPDMATMDPLIVDAATASDPPPPPSMPPPPLES
jgi:hypothetical protein